MGNYDDIAPDSLRTDLARFAELIQRLDEAGELLEATPRLITMMGDLRQKLFAYEVRSTHRLEPPEKEEAEELREEAERIVREAREREEQARREWDRGWDVDEEDPGE